MTVKFSHERKVRSLAKKTLGSTRVGSAIRLPAITVSVSQLHIPLRREKKWAYQVPTEEEVGWTSWVQLARKLSRSAGAGRDDWRSAAEMAEDYVLQRARVKLRGAD